MTRTKRFRLLVATALSMVMFALPASTAEAADDYPYSGADHNMDCNPDPVTRKDRPCVLDDWGFYKLQCTSFVAWRMVHNNGFKDFNNYMTGKDNRLSAAKNWGVAAQKAGYVVDDKPAKGSVMWQTSPQHVAWVESVSATTGKIVIEEYNKSYTGTYNRREISYSGLKFIHFKDIKDDPKPQAAAPKPKTSTPAPAPSGVLASYAGSYSYKPAPGWTQTLILDSAGNATYKGEGSDYPSYTQTGKFKSGTVYVVDSVGAKPYQTSALIPTSGGPAILNDMFIKRDTGVLAEADNYDASYPDAAFVLPSVGDNSGAVFCATNASNAWKKKCGI